ncbi:MAG: hypothetical protein LBI03_06910, partial [Clostridiales bacterium]|nr:hypothetical protein [Clostridiales bacterium]
MEFKYAACSRKSKKHDTNEDNIFINGSYYKTKEKTDDLINGESSEQTQMFAVFDGFGQNNTGYKASYIASGILEKYKKAGRQPNFNVYKFLDGYVLEANRVILENVNANNGLQFGTSAGLLYISANRAFMYNLGDVRVYLYRDCELMQLSEDHTQAQRMVNLGVLRKEKARIHSQKDKLTQY